MAGRILFVEGISLCLKFYIKINEFTYKCSTSQCSADTGTKINIIRLEYKLSSGAARLLSSTLPTVCLCTCFQASHLLGSVFGAGAQFCPRTTALRVQRKPHYSWWFHVTALRILLTPKCQVLVRKICGTMPLLGTMQFAEVLIFMCNVMNKLGESHRCLLICLSLWY